MRLILPNFNPMIKMLKERNMRIRHVKNQNDIYEKEYISEKDFVDKE